MDYNHDVPLKSKRAMATAALFTDIFSKYLDRNKCENIPSSNQEELDQFSGEILDHVIIVGGFCRDILLNRSINDIDIVINLRELCKLQTNHLKKYHSKTTDQDKSVRCIYWQRYLERFNANESAVNDERTQKEMVMMHNLNYIFNSSFWLKILKMDDLLDNKLSTKDVAKHGFVSAQIVNTVKYGNINLDQQSIDFIDTFSVDQCYGDSFVSKLSQFNTFHRKSRQLSMSGITIDRKDLEDDNHNYDEHKGNKSRPEHDDNLHKEHKERKEHKDRKGRLKSMAIIEFDIDDLGTEFGNFNKDSNLSRPEYISLEIPIYSGKVRYKLLNYDFSINTAILPLSNIIKLKQYNNDYNGDDNDNTVPMTWVEIVENGLGECDAIQDISQHKILKCPESDHERCTIEAHPITFVFFRIITWMIREPSFKIDNKLIIAQIADYDHWLNEKWFDNEKHCDKFMNHLCDILQNECNTVNDVEQMISVMHLLQFNMRFIKIVTELQNVRHALVDCISLVRNDNITNDLITAVFKANKYPIEQQLFKIPSKTEEELESLKTKKTFLESQIETKNERIKELEKQNDRLLNEVQYLQQLNQNNDRVQELEQQNSRLLQELQVINESKIQLALTANDTIDELRNYLIEYQEAILNRI